MMIFGAFLLLPYFVNADADSSEISYHLVQLSYAGNKKKTGIMSVKAYKNLEARMLRASKGSSLVSNSKKFLPKWTMILGSYTGKKEAQLALAAKKQKKVKRPKKKLPKDFLKAKNKEPYSYATSVQKAKKVIDHDPEKVEKKRATLEAIRNELATESVIPCKHKLGDPLVDSLVDLDKRLANTDRLMKTNPHKLDTIKLDR